MKVRTTGWDAVAAAAPNDRVAGRVVSQNGEHYEGGPRDPTRVHTGNRPLLKMRSALGKPGQAVYDELVGKRFGRLTVIGIDATPPASRMQRKEARWVVRCDCGRYEHRKAKTLRGGLGEFHLAACVECVRLDRARRLYAEEGGRGIGAFAGAGEMIDG